MPSELLDTEVYWIRKGVGTFLSIFSTGRGHKYQLWIYLARWALVRNDEKLVSSASSCGLDAFNFRELFSGGVTYKFISDFENGEFSILFSNGLRLQIWGEDRNDGSRSTLLYVYRDDTVIAEVKSA